LRRSEAGPRGRGPASRSFAISLPSRHAGVLRQELNKPGTEWRRPTASAGRPAGPPDTDRPPLTPAARHARAAGIRQRRAPDGAPQTSPLFEEAGLSAANDG